MPDRLTETHGRRQRSCSITLPIIILAPYLDFSEQKEAVCASCQGNSKLQRGLKCAAPKDSKELLPLE